MRVMKFGGSSIADAGLFYQVMQLVLQANKQEPVAVVLSAPQQVTNILVTLIEEAKSGLAFETELSLLADKFDQFIHDARSNQWLDESQVQLLKTLFTAQFSLWQQKLNGIRLLNACPEPIYAEIVTAGERMSIAIMQAFLQSAGYASGVIEPCEYLVASGDPLNAVVDIEESKAKLARLNVSAHNIWLMSGFTAGNEQGQCLSLGRNGSDYSAAVLAACLEASRCEIWTDVDGIFNADPRVVSEAQLVPEMSYQEAMALSYFGAKVLHPKTITPIAQFHIPCFIKNTHNPLAEGTLISDQSQPTAKVVKGISNLDGQSMFEISGPGLKGLVGITSRVLSVIANAGVSVSLVSQSSSEYSVSFCVATVDADKVEFALKQAFVLELASELMEPIRVHHGLAIVTLVGDGMRTHKGIAASFLKALAQAQINIIALAQGASERSISAVILQSKVIMATKACHQRFFDPQRYLDIFLVGSGNVGAGLLTQIRQQQEALKQMQISIRVCGILNSQQMLLSATGIDLADWQNQLEASEVQSDLKVMMQFAKEQQLLNPVFVDCTSSDQVAGRYLSALKAGLHIVTPNKKANTGAYCDYQALKQTALDNRRQFLYETTVGAGLPVIDNLQKLLMSGDKLKQFNGILSGSLSFIFGLLEEGVSISEATKIARDKCFTEPDPRDDLSGMDVARKVLILAREAGMCLSLEDIHIESILPQGFDDSGSVEQFMTNLKQADQSVAERVQAAKAEGKVLRYVGQIDEQGGRVVIAAVDAHDPLYSVKGGENALAFYSHYYQPIPFVLRGYGAGTDVTAAGVFADVLRTLHWEREVM